MTATAGRKWMRAQLARLMHEYGIDGFKFDGGGVSFYSALEGINGKTACDYTQAWFQFAATYPYNEAKDTWKGGGLALNQRLRDKNHSWGDEGLACILPDAFNAALTGHPFMCPDMVGGGEWSNFEPGHVIDEELIVRCAQVSALFPMMQFSVAPWRVLSAENCARVLAAARLHAEKGEWLYSLVCESASTGEPLLSPMCYHFPDQGLERVLDQFMLGKNVLVAPILAKNAVQRMVVLPEGEWRDELGNVFSGGNVTIPVNLDRLPVFTRV